MFEQSFPAAAAVVADLRTEGELLYARLKDMDTGYWTSETSFDRRTVWDIVAQLHITDFAALTTLQSDEAFRQLARALETTPSYAARWLARSGSIPKGPDLLDLWRSTFVELCHALDAADPVLNHPWFGYDMSAHAISANRLAETWARGWAVCDLMNLQPKPTDRIASIAAVGVHSYARTFQRRNLPAPYPAPHVRLKAPSGATWEWHPENQNDSVQGDAIDFCQVVTQTCRIEDTHLIVRGDAAITWLTFADSIASPPSTQTTSGGRATPQER